MYALGGLITRIGNFYAFFVVDLKLETGNL